MIVELKDIIVETVMYIIYVGFVLYHVQLSAPVCDITSSSGGRMLAHHLHTTDMPDLLLALSKPTPPLLYLLCVELFLSSSGVQLLY